MSQDILLLEDFVPGWESRPEEVQAVASLQPIGAFEDSPAGQDAAPLPDYVSHQEAAKKVTGALLPTRNQGNAGTCVSFGTVRAIEFLILVMISRGAAWVWNPLGLATEPVYGGSRVEVGGGRLGFGDGSIGAWAAEFVKRWGVAWRAVYQALGLDLSAYSITTSRIWGRSGVPDAFEPTLKGHPVKGITKITTIDGLKRALANGYGVAESSGYLLRSTRDANGIIDAYPGGGHCMCISGYIVIDGATYFFIENSWGDGAHKGPTHPKFPSTSGGLVHEKKVALMLKDGDTWAFSDMVGFPARDLVDWYL